VPKAEHLEPFLDAAREVLEQELGTVVERERLTLAEGNETTQQITTIVGITGRLTGLAIYGMSALKRLCRHPAGCRSQRDGADQPAGASETV
jgi:CheY-specific phosphatase CheX